MDQQIKILPNGLEAPDRKNQIQLIKSGVLAVIAVLSFGLTWQLLAAGFLRGEPLFFWIFPSLSAALGVTFLAFLGIVNRNKILFWGTSFAIFFWYALVVPPNWFAIIGGATFFLLSLWFDTMIKHDEKFRADFSLSRIIRDCINIMVYALLLVIGFNIYVKASTDFKNNPKGLYNQIGHYAARGLEYVPSGLGDFNPDQSFNDFVAKQAAKQEPGFASIPDQQKIQVLEEVKKQLTDQFHIQVSGNPLLGQVVAGFVSEKVESASVSYQRFFPAIFAVIVAALLRTLAFLFVWLTLLVSWTAFRLLLLVKFFRIEKVPVEVDKLQV